MLIFNEERRSFKKLLIVCLAAGSLVLTACPRIELKDGTIPAEHMVEAQKLAGYYTGEFDRKEGVFEISYIGNKPVVKFLDRQNLTLSKDLLFEGCNSSIDQIKSISVEKIRAGGNTSSDQYRLTEADFAFNPGQCSDEVIGRELYLSFSKDYQVIRADLLERYDEHCRWDQPNPYPPGGGGGRTCEYIPVYRKGRFVKINQ
jgi:hypothetical protein